MYERKTPNLNTHRTTTASTTKSPTPIKQGTRQRTGRAPLTSTTNQQQLTDEQKQIQSRIAARAATAMAQIRRRHPRSYMLWGDNRKAVIKRYPDGAQEIMVPQTLTPEQEQYEFPPRSRLLKKLATSTAERHRLSSLQYNITTAPTVPPPLHSISFSHQAKPTVMTNMTKPHPTVATELDQGALAEWFSEKQQQKHSQQHSAKEKAVLDWMIDVERSTSVGKKSDGSSIKKRSTINDKKSHSSTKLATPNMHDIDLHFKSEAGKLVASGLCCQKSFNYLSPPGEDTKKHHVRLRQLDKHGNKPRKTTTTTQTISYQPYISVSSSNRQRQKNESSKPSPKSGLVRLVQMFHKTLQDQQARAHIRMQQLESLLEEERHKRQDIQRTQQKTMSQLDTFMKKYQEQRIIPPSPILSTASSSPSPASPSWMSILSPHSSSSSFSKKTDQHDSENWMERITRLEARVQNETKSMQTLQKTVVSTVQWIDGLKVSLSTQALDHSLSQRHLEMRINETFNKLSILTRQRNG